VPIAKSGSKTVHWLRPELICCPYISPGSPNQRLGWLGLVENETISRQSPAFTIDEATPPNIYHMQESRYYTN
jgi:hypothetical protein